MAEDCLRGFDFKSTETDGRTEILDPYAEMKSSVYDKTFDPWSAEGFEAAEMSSDDMAPIQIVDEFDLLI